MSRGEDGFAIIAGGFLPNGSAAGDQSQHVNGMTAVPNGLGIWDCYLDDHSLTWEDIQVHYNATLSAAGAMGRAASLVDFPWGFSLSFFDVDGELIDTDIWVTVVRRPKK